MSKDYRLKQIILNKSELEDFGDENFSLMDYYTNLEINGTFQKEEWFIKKFSLKTLSFIPFYLKTDLSEEIDNTLISTNSFGLYELEEQQSFSIRDIIVTNESLQKIISQPFGYIIIDFLMYKEEVEE